MEGGKKRESERKWFDGKSVDAFLRLLKKLTERVQALVVVLVPFRVADDELFELGLGRLVGGHFFLDEEREREIELAREREGKREREELKKFRK